MAEEALALIFYPHDKIETCFRILEIEPPKWNEPGHSSGCAHILDWVGTKMLCCLLCPTSKLRVGLKLSKSQSIGPSLPQMYIYTHTVV